MEELRNSCGNCFLRVVLRLFSCDQVKVAVGGIEISDMKMVKVAVKVMTMTWACGS